MSAVEINTGQDFLCELLTVTIISSDKGFVHRHFVDDALAAFDSGTTCSSLAFIRAAGMIQSVPNSSSRTIAAASEQRVAVSSKPHERTIRPRSRLCRLPCGSKLVVVQSPVSGGFLLINSPHAAPDRQHEIIVAASVSVEQLGEERQHSLGHVRATSLFEVVKKADDIATLDLLDRTIAECRKDQPPQGPFSCVGASEFLGFTLDVALGDRLQRRPLGNGILSASFRAS
jgi:hypothetical protein